MEIRRYLASAIRADALAKHKMAFVSGPRQVGKSTLAKQLLTSAENYFLYDQDEFRRAWAKSPEQAIAHRRGGPVVLDELHKDRKWKLHLKGIYDRFARELPVIVTGSARLDLYRRGSDSLLGRYFPYRLHPLSVAETEAPVGPDEILHKERPAYPWEALLVQGGFPEPLLAAKEKESQRWSRLRLDRLVLEDTRDFLNISDLQAFRSLISLLPERVGSLFSVNSLREDVGKAYATVRSWVQVLDTLYHCFTIKPFHKRLNRSIRSEPKLYLYDILQISRVLKAKRLENLAALHLLKACHFWTDTAQGEFDLHFVRNKDGREVDFLVLRDGGVWMLVECKTADKEPAEDLVKYTQLLKPAHAIQLVDDRTYDREYPALHIRVMGYEKFFAGLV
jgi:uncharacterized protein